MECVGVGEVLFLVIICNNMIPLPLENVTVYMQRVMFDVVDVQ